MMDVRLHYRGVDPQLRTIFQSQIDRCSNHQIIDSFQCLGGQSNEAALERVVFGHCRAVEVGKLS